MKKTKENTMKDIIMDTVLDSLRLIPFLFLAFLIIEVIEHKLNKKTKKIISSSNRFGPLIGSLLGLFPQCGFSVMATNLYVTRIISLGTLIAIYLSTSDEMLPILLSERVAMSVILKILAIKFLVGMISGFIIDFILRKKQPTKQNYEICTNEHCHCNENNILLSSLKHTINTVLFIFLITFILNNLMSYVEEEQFSNLFLKNNLFAPFLSSVIGLIPNCGASVMITELYLKGILSLGTAAAGLLTGSGVAILVLFKTNKDGKENIKILLILYFIGAISGVIINLIEKLL